MPVWEIRCPKCNYPMRVDTQYSKVTCPHCRERYFTEEVLHERTPYHTETASKSTSYQSSKSTRTKTSKADWSFLSAMLGTSKKSTSKKSNTTQLDAEAIGCLIAVFIFCLPIALIIWLFQSLF